MLFQRGLTGRNLATRIVQSGAVSVCGVLTRDTRRALLSELNWGDWVEAARVVPGKDHIVIQELSQMSAFPAWSLFYAVQQGLEQMLHEMGSEHPQIPFPGDFRFNEVKAQRYHPGSCGVTPHRDFRTDPYLVAIFVLEGKINEGFALCRDRKGISPVHPLLLRNDPGALILMGMPGFLGNSDIWPMHFVTPLTLQRTIFVLRRVVTSHDTLPSG